MASKRRQALKAKQQNKSIPDNQIKTTADFETETERDSERLNGSCILRHSGHLLCVLLSSLEQILCRDTGMHSNKISWDSQVWVEKRLQKWETLVESLEYKIQEMVITRMSCESRTVGQTMQLWVYIIYPRRRLCSRRTLDTWVFRL